MIALENRLEILESIIRLSELPHWERLRGEAISKIERNEASVSKVVFRSRTPIDPIEIEYSRGFRQGVMYVIDALPRQAKAELIRRLAATEERDA